MEQIPEKKQTVNDPASACTPQDDRIALLAQISRYTLKNHSEEGFLLDIASGRVRPLPECGETPGVFLRACAGGYEAGIRRLMDGAGSEEDREALSRLLPEAMLPALQGTGRLQARCRVRDDSGAVLWRLAECSFFGEGEMQVLFLSADIQEEEAVQQHLRDAVEEAQAASRAKSAFLANMSHEIRTPMNAIVGISEVLLRKDLPRDVLDSLSIIQNSGSSLLGIINDILDFSKIETGKFEITEVEYMLPSLLMDISNVISVRLASKPVFFTMDIDPSLPNYFVGDDIRIKQILMNLLGNAVKFTHEGSIILQVWGSFTGKDQFELRFDVRDTGIGIREEDMGKLFATFSQVDTRKNRGTTGSGLGLAISRNLTRLMGGDLTVRSVYGQGSVFSVRVLQHVPRYTPIGEVKDKSARLLICEQNERLVQSLAAAAEHLGLQYAICRETDKIREYAGMTHVLIRRRCFGPVQEKLKFMFRNNNILLILDNDEQAESTYMDYKQLQLPLITLQLINALNGDEIVSSVKKKNFDRSQILPLTFARVLVVDDNSTNLQVAMGLMSPYRMQIDVCTSGFEAIEKVKTTHYDAIFMDHMMPEMDGIEAARLIRGLDGEYYRQVPIIALTANAMSNAREQFLQAGMNDFVAKPIEMQELHRVIKKYIQANAPADYLDQVKKEQAAGKTGPGEKTAPSRLPPLPAGPAPAPGSRLEQLLQQNSALLEQNLAILNAIRGEASAPAEPEPPGEEAAMAPSGELPDRIPGIEMSRSLQTYGGSVEVYHNILRAYYTDIQEKLTQLPLLFENRDTENFTIQVHALKSASRGAGALELGEEAYQLELAGKSGDWPRIEALFPSLMRDLRSMTENVGRYAEKYLIQKKPSGEFCEHFDQELTVQLRRACEEMDYLRAEDILKELREKEYPDPLSRQLDDMCACSASFDYDRLEELVSAL